MWRRKVLWSEGLFLRPQHFQQSERFVENQLDRRLKAVGSYGWGFEQLQIDESLLTQGRIGLRSVSAVLPDGTALRAPLDDPLPEPLALDPQAKPGLVYLGVVLDRPGAANATLLPSGSHALFRYQAETTEVPDAIDGFTEPAPMQTGALRLVLLDANDRTDAYSAVPLARVLERRADGQVVLDPQFVPPTLSCADNRVLATWISELRGRLRQTAEVLAQSMTQPGRGGVSEIAEFLWLQVVNRYSLLFDHLGSVPRLHPESFYSTCLQLAGDLVAFCPERRFERSFPEYDHDDVALTFRPVIDFIRQAFSRLPQKSAVRIDLQVRNANLRVATIGDRDLLDNASFVLAATAQMPSEALRQQVPSQAKIASVDRIKEIVNRLLPGVPLRAMPQVPRQIPFHAGYDYFELDTRDLNWKAIAQSGNLCMHIAGTFPGLEVELWAIRG